MDLLPFLLVEVQGVWGLLVEQNLLVCVVHALPIDALVFKDLV